MCWTLTGFASGYLSRAHGKDIYCLEERCRGKGDAVCRVVGRPIDEWGEAVRRASALLREGVHGVGAGAGHRAAEAGRAQAAHAPPGAGARGRGRRA